MLFQKDNTAKVLPSAKHHALKNTEQKPDADTLPSVLSSIKQIKTKEVPATLSAKASYKAIEIVHPKVKPTLLTDGCDTLILRNGTVILAKVLEITPEQIKFRYCDAPNEVLRSINKSDANYIIYATGLKEVFGYNPDAPYYYSLPRKTNKFVVAGFVLGMLSVPLSLILASITGLSSSVNMGIYLVYFIPFIIPLLAITLCIAGSLQIYKNKGKRRGLGPAIIGLVIALIVLAILVVLLMEVM